ncbi:hypothetical protein AUP91_12810 [Escherichia coli]|nr:hypothetical protein AUP92_21335 [Escherichia coli]KXR96876.1 hypothetical protein AUP91_12810 [Escherichia coli]
MAFCFRNPRAFTASACVSSDDARMSRRNIWEQSGNKSSSHVLSRAISRVLISCMVSSLSGKYRGVAKLEGNTKAKVLQVLATFAYADYCRSAATPGARCRDCHGTGRAVDIAKTELWGRVVEKECGRCKGVGYSRMPASAAYRAVTMLIPNLTQPTWSRTVKPLYDALVVQCHKEESIADNILNAVTR